MTSFKLPETEGKPIGIVDFKVNLLASPPEINDRVIDAVDNYVSSQTGAIHIDYKDAIIDEGRLNIYICRFPTGKHCVHIFGKIKGKEFRTEKEIHDASSNSLGIINQRIKYVLISSRNILRNYYLSSNLKSIENHIMAFILPL